MHDSLLVHMAKGTGDLMHIIPDSKLLNAAFLCLSLSNDPFQIPTLGPLDCNKKLILAHKAIQVLDYIGMTKRLKEFNFLDSLLPLFWIQHIENLR
jgi:hypothetical protein